MEPPRTESRRTESRQIECRNCRTGRVVDGRVRPTFRDCPVCGHFDFGVLSAPHD